MSSSFHEVTINVRVEVTDPAALKAQASFCSQARDGSGNHSVYVPASVELALVDRFAALMNELFEPAFGMRVVQHRETLQSWAVGPRPPE